MILHEDVVDRKLIAFAAKFKTALVRLIQHNITPNYFKDSYESIVREMFSYYHKYYELITPDALSQALVDQRKDTNTITAAVATLEDIINDPDLAADKNSLTELDFFADRIKKRKALELCKDTAIKLGNSCDTSRLDNAKKLMMEAITQMDKISSNGDILEGTLGDFADLRIKRYDERLKFPERFRGIQSGFPALDAVTDGYQPGDLVIYVAESGGGKSVNLLHTAFQAWSEKYPGAGEGANVVLFSLEMDWTQYLRRFDAMHSGLDMYKLKSSTLNETEYVAWSAAIDEQKKKQNLFYLVDMPAGCTTLYIRNKLEEIRMKYPDNPIDMVIIDYLGIMSPSQNVKEGDWLKQGLISQECKELARLEKVVVVTAVQETRESIKDGKDGKAKNKTTAVLSRSQMIVTNANIILYSRPHQIEENDDDFELFKTYNDNPNLIHYQVIKSRDSSKVSFCCGANFSKMFIQPLDPDKKDDPSNMNLAANAKLAIKNQIPKTKIEIEDEEEFGGYYESVRTNSIAPGYQHISA